MNVSISKVRDTSVAVVYSETPVITDGQSALEFAINIGYEYNLSDIAINKAAVSEDFFDLSTRIAGEVVQKFVNYGYRLAIIGDFSHYASESLRDYIYESNNGNHLFFVSTEEEAIAKFG